MATSGENVKVTKVLAECSQMTRLFDWDLICNFAGLVDLEFDTDGSAQWTCPSCHHLHVNHVSDFE